MIVLQILAIPCVVLLLVIGIFMIGSTGIKNDGSITQDTQALNRVMRPDPTLINTQLCLPLHSRYSATPDRARLVQTQNDYPEFSLPGDAIEDFSTIKTIG